MKSRIAVRVNLIFVGIPALPDGAMVFVESVTSFSPLPFVTCIRGRTIVIDNDMNEF